MIFLGRTNQKHFSPDSKTQCFVNFRKQKTMKTMETKNNQNQIIIKTNTTDDKQKLPANLLLSLAAGAIAGVIIIFGIFWGAEILFGL